jgi:hypothetical protein
MGQSFDGMQAVVRSESPFYVVIQIFLEVFSHNQTFNKNCQLPSGNTEPEGFLLLANSCRARCPARI